MDQLAQREKWLLQFLGADGNRYEVDQVRVMKGMFLLSQLPEHPAADLYSFQAYDYGPFDSQVYRDLEALRLKGLIDVTGYVGSSRRIFKLTEEGRRTAMALQRAMSDETYEHLAATKRHVTSLSFNALLQDIYTRFPKYRERSVARVAHPPAR